MRAGEDTHRLDELQTKREVQRSADGDCPSSKRSSWPEECEMLWIGIGVTTVVAFAVIALLLLNHRAGDLGSVSAHWIMAHRIDR